MVLDVAERHSLESRVGEAYDRDCLRLWDVGMAAVEVGDDVGGVDEVFGTDPVTFLVALPLDEICGAAVSTCAEVEDGLNLPFLLAINQNGRRSGRRNALRDGIAFRLLELDDGENVV